MEGTWCARLLMCTIILLAKDQVELQVILDVVGKYAMKWRLKFKI